ncbi:MAG: OadG family protein [Lachnospiraceae bacterium]|nr:OadG family protein [Lachnospiraceae bacterium]
MKKWLLILGMVTCLSTAAACGKEENDYSAQYQVTQEMVDSYVQQQLEGFNSVVEQGAQAYLAEDPVASAAVAGWESALADMGDYQSIESITYIVDEDGVMTIDAAVKGTKRDASVQFVLEYSVTQGFALSSVTTTVTYTFGELMKNAGLNTLIGMGTVFVVLILICLIISCFNFIPKIQKAFSKKEKKAEASVDGAVAQIVQNEEVNETDDLELIAVIAAAVAASEGAASSDGYVVRSIRRVR